MKVWNFGALAGAVVLAGATTPAAMAHAQSSAPRAVQVIGRGAHIGVTVRDVDSTDAGDPKAGVVIEDVDPGSAADKAGMKTGDAITELDGERVRSSMQFTRLVRETPEGRGVSAVLSRGGQQITVTVTPDRATLADAFGMRMLDVPSLGLAIPPAPPAPAAPRTPRPPAPLLGPSMPFEILGRVRNAGRLGVTVEDLDTQLAEYFGVKAGVLVKSVSEGSVAGKAGLKAGDVITSVNGRHVYDTSDVTRALDRLESNGELTLEVTRDRKTQTLKGKLEAREVRGRTRARTIV
ncbi:MAG TPA: PDZ domain-containing protein [Vicinamibacterales bacterium]